MVRLLVLIAGLGSQVFIFGLMLLYIVPVFFGFLALHSFKFALVGLVSKANSSVIFQDLKNGFWFSVITVITFLAMYNRKVIWQWLSQFL